MTDQRGVMPVSTTDLTARIKKQIRFHRSNGNAALLASALGALLADANHWNAAAVHHRNIGNEQAALMYQRFADSVRGTVAAMLDVEVGDE